MKRNVRHLIVYKFASKVSTAIAELKGELDNTGSKEDEIK